MVYKVHCLLRHIGMDTISHHDYILKPQPDKSFEQVIALTPRFLETDILNFNYEVMLIYSQHEGKEYFWSKLDFKVSNRVLEELNKALEPYNKCVIYNGRIRLINNKIPTYEQIKESLNFNGLVNYVKLLCKGRR